MSLWNVNDAETEKLMTLFAAELLKPHSFFPAEHWRQTVLQYKRSGGTDPLNWAAFQTFGVPYRLKGPVAITLE
jgi:CHAT domain-containing protein